MLHRNIKIMLQCVKITRCNNPRMTGVFHNNLRTTTGPALKYRYINRLSKHRQIPPIGIANAKITGELTLRQ